MFHGTFSRLSLLLEFFLYQCLKFHNPSFLPRLGSYRSEARAPTFKQNELAKKRGSTIEPVAAEMVIGAS